MRFRLGKEVVAILVLRIREIMSLQEITPIAQTPGYVKGIVNLRGRVIPVIDTRLRFGMPEAEPTPRTCIIVVQMDDETARMPVGLIVDGVVEVLTLQPGDIDRVPDFDNCVVTPYLIGVAKIKARVKMLLDINRVFTTQEIQDLRAIVQ